MKPQTFALITAGVVGGTGLLGMSHLMDRGTNDHAEQMTQFKGFGKIGGVVPTNDLFNWVRVGIGIAGLLAAQNEKAAIAYNRSVAVSYAGMAVMGLVPQTDTLFGKLPIFGANVALHAGITAAELLTEERLMAKAKDLVPLAKSFKNKITKSRARA